MAGSATIEIERGPDSQPQRFTVTVREAGTQSRHEVTLRDPDWHRLAGDRSAESLIEAAFRFLLDREPKESILSRFDLMVIGRYFPEFEAELPAYMQRR